METPSSMRRIPRSENKTKQEGGSKIERAALVDITNDSPIVGLATGSFLKSPESADVAAGSGEALLRGQVKTLLKKIEEEQKMLTQIPHHRYLPLSRGGFLGFARSPMQLLAPTPANTPQLAEADGVMQQPQIVLSLTQENESLGPCMLNRALLFDSPEKEEPSGGSSSILSSLSYQASEISSSYKERSSLDDDDDDDDDDSVWSVQASAGTEEDESRDLLEDFDGGEEEFDELEELCEGVGNMFTGSHTRFDESDDELEGGGDSREECIGKHAASPEFCC